MAIEIMTAQEAKAQALNGYDVECRKDVANAIVTAVNKKEMKATVRVLTPTVEAELVEKGYYIVKKGNGWILTWDVVATADEEDKEEEGGDEQGEDKQGEDKQDGDE